MIVSVKIEIPDGYELAEETTRPPRKGELYVHFYGDRVVEALDDWPIRMENNRIIVRPSWKWPDWLLNKFVIQVPMGEWFGADGDPVAQNGYWDGLRNVTALAKTTFSPPPCSDWRKSLRRNPNK